MNKNSLVYKELEEKILSLANDSIFDIVLKLDVKPNVRTNLNPIFNVIAKDINGFVDWIVDYKNNGVAQYISETFVDRVFRDYATCVRVHVLPSRKYSEFYICGKIDDDEGGFQYTEQHVYDPETWRAAIKENIDTLLLLISSQDDSYITRLIPFVHAEAINSIKKFLGD